MPQAADRTAGQQRRRIDPSGVSTPEPDNTPAPEPPKAPVPEQLSDTIPAAPAENEDPQDQAEPAEPEPVKTETPKSAEPKQPENPPAETKSAEPVKEQKPAEKPPVEQQPSSGGGLSAEDIKSLEEAGFKVSKPREKNEEAQSQQMPSPEEIRQHLQETDPNYHVDKNGNVISSAAIGDSKVGLD